jgi:ABC transport system ATP-binding/permease protein
VFCAAIMTAIVVVSKGLPTNGAVLLADARLELCVVVAATCVASTILGLFLSALARSHMQILLLLVVAITVQLLLSRGIIAVTDRLLLDQFSWLMPARWGFAGSASTIDLNNVELSPSSSHDSHWNHTTVVWLLEIGMLALLSAAYAGLVWWRIRLRPH